MKNRTGTTFNDLNKFMTILEKAQNVDLMVLEDMIAAEKRRRAEFDRKVEVLTKVL